MLCQRLALTYLDLVGNGCLDLVSVPHQESNIQRRCFKKTVGRPPADISGCAGHQDGFCRHLISHACDVSARFGGRALNIQGIFMYWNNIMIHQRKGNDEKRDMRASALNIGANTNPSPAIEIEAVRATLYPTVF